MKAFICCGFIFLIIDMAIAGHGHTVGAVISSVDSSVTEDLPSISNWLASRKPESGVYSGLQHFIYERKALSPEFQKAFVEGAHRKITEAIDELYPNDLSSVCLSDVKVKVSPFTAGELGVNFPLNATEQHFLNSVLLAEAKGCLEVREFEKLPELTLSREFRRALEIPVDDFFPLDEKFFCTRGSVRAYGSYYSCAKVQLLRLPATQVLQSWESITLAGSYTPLYFKEAVVLFRKFPAKPKDIVAYKYIHIARWLDIGSFGASMANFYQPFWLRSAFQTIDPR